MKTIRPLVPVFVLASLGGQAVKAVDPGVRGARLAYPRMVTA